MIKPGSPYKACNGAFDSTAANRPDAPVFFDNPPVGAGTTWRVRRYQPGYDGTFVPVTTTPKRAPYGTLDWFARNAMIPMRGQEPLDSDGVLGISFLAPTGWTSSIFPPRLPRSLIIFGENTFAPFDPDWVSAVAGAIAPLSAMGVDVYLSPAFVGGTRFLLGTPVSAATFDASGAPDLTYTNVTAINPLDLVGGDVMIAAVGFYSTGYCTQGDFFSLNGLPDPCYVTYATDSSVSWNRPVTNLGSGGIYTTFLQTGSASYESSLLLPITTQCRRFAFDVYGNDANVPLPTAVNPTLEQCDLAFRNGIPGKAYHYTATGPTPAEDVTVANLIVGHALAFFS